MVVDRQARWSVPPPLKRVGGGLNALAMVALVAFTLGVNGNRVLLQPPNPTMLTQIDTSVWSVTFSPVGRLLAVSDPRADAVELWDVNDPVKPVRVSTLTGHRNAPDVAFSPDGRTLITSGNGPTTTLWDVSDATRPVRGGSLPGTGATVAAVAFSPDGRTVATGSEDATASLWNVTDRSHPVRAAVLSGHGKTVSDVAFRPDGRTLATASHDGTVALWDATDIAHPNRLAVLTGHTDAVTRVAFSPDGRTLATGSHDKTAALWDVSQPARPSRSAVIARNRNGYQLSQITDLAFTPDGRALAVASFGFFDHTPLWEVTDPAHPTPGASIGATELVAFSPDGRVLATTAAIVFVHQMPKDGPVWDLRNRLHPIVPMPTEDIIYVAWFALSGLTLLALALLLARRLRLSTHLRVGTAAAGVLYLAYTVVLLVVLDIRAIADTQPMPEMVPIMFLIWAYRDWKRHRPVLDDGATGTA